MNDEKRPQLENGYVKIANEIIEALARLKMSGREWQVLMVIFRKTYGWNKKSDKISLSQISEMTGISRAHAAKVVKQLCDKGVAEKGNSYITTYRFQKVYKKWKVLPKKATAKSVAQNGNRVLPKTATKVLPKTATTKDNKNTITKDSIYIVADDSLSDTQNQEEQPNDPKKAKQAILKAESSQIVAHWNTRRLIVHKGVGAVRGLSSALGAALRRHSMTKILVAIDNYAEVYHSDEYFWNHKWNLKDFLNRGLDKFVPEAEPKNNYRRNKNGKRKGIESNLDKLAKVADRYN